VDQVGVSHGLRQPSLQVLSTVFYLQGLLKGQALSCFEHHLMRRLEAEDSDVPDNKIIELVLRDVDLEYIPNATYAYKSLI
jgi:hypothetical protein